MKSKSVTELAIQISSNTQIYSDYLTHNALPLPSHSPVSSSDTPSMLPKDVAAALDTAIESTHELHQLLIGPVGRIMGAAAECNKLMSLHFIDHNRIVEKVPIDKPITFKEIADQCSLEEEDTKRMLRLAMTDHLFTEPEPGFVAHTASSQVMAENPLLAAWVGVATHENWPSMLHLSNALSRWPGSEEPIETAYALAHSVNENPFTVWERDPPRAKRFADAIKFLHSDAGFDPAHLVSGYDFDSLGACLFVDVGGSQGHVSVALAERYADMRCIVQDMPAVVQWSRSHLAVHLQGRVEVMEHDFWTEQPVRDADVYYFRWIFHDWSDKWAVKILRQLIPALKTGARVLINDICLPPQGALSLYQERWLRGIDVNMKSFLNAKERDAEQWAGLFARADSRFKFLGLRIPEGSKCAIIEAEWTSTATSGGGLPVVTNDDPTQIS